jgi:hypothetical protein
MLLVDVQGTKSSGGYVLTDPAFHTKDGAEYGDTNLGIKGIQSFFKSHKCESTCKALKLEYHPVMTS